MIEQAHNGGDPIAGCRRSLATQLVISKPGAKNDVALPEQCVKAKCSVMRSGCPDVGSNILRDEAATPPCCTDQRTGEIVEGDVGHSRAFGQRGAHISQGSAINSAQPWRSGYDRSHGLQQHRASSRDHIPPTQRHRAAKSREVSQEPDINMLPGLKGAPRRYYIPT